MLAYTRAVCDKVTSLQDQGHPVFAYKLFDALLVVLKSSREDLIWQEPGLDRLLGQLSVALAIQLLQQGYPDQCDQLLLRLGFKYRLAASAFQPYAARPISAPHAAPGTADPHQGPLPSLPTAPPLVIDGVMDPALLCILQHGFRPVSPFWREHGYWSPSTGFFSYVYPLSQQPLHPVEEAVQQLRARVLQGDVPHSRQMGGYDGMRQRTARATHAEWWVHCRDPTAPHQLHFDLDETQLGRGLGSYSLRHPLCSSLIFLEGDPSRHGPTLVLDQTPAEQGLAQRGWLVHPAKGRFGMFRGDLLHGVMPGPPPATLPSAPGTSSTAPPPARTTLIVAWWELSAEQERQLGGQHTQREAEVAEPGPMQLPPWRRPGSGHCTWPSAFGRTPAEPSLEGASPGEQPPGCPAAGGTGPAHSSNAPVTSSSCMHSPAATPPAWTLLQPAWERVAPVAGPFPEVQSSEPPLSEGPLGGDLRGAAQQAVAHGSGDDGSGSPGGQPPSGAALGEGGYRAGGGPEPPKPSDAESGGDHPGSAPGGDSPGLMQGGGSSGPAQEGGSLRPLQRDGSLEYPRSPSKRRRPCVRDYPGLQLQFPPLRYFLAQAGDIRRAYVPQ